MTPNSRKKEFQLDEKQMSKAFIGIETQNNSSSGAEISKFESHLNIARAAIDFPSLDQALD